MAGYHSCSFIYTGWPRLGKGRKFLKVREKSDSGKIFVLVKVREICLPADSLQVFLKIVNEKGKSKEV